VAEEALANATPFLQAFGHVVVAWLWLDVALAAERATAALEPGKLAGKLAAMRYFFAYELPKSTPGWRSSPAALTSCRTMHEDWF